MRDYLERFKNPGTILSVTAVVGLLLMQFGVGVDLEWLDTTVKLVCSLCVLLGVMNNPTTPGLDLPVVKETEN